MYSSQGLGIAVTLVLAVLVAVLLMLSLLLFICCCHARRGSQTSGICCDTHGKYKPSAVDTVSPSLALQEMGGFGLRNKQFDEETDSPTMQERSADVKGE